MPPAMLSPGSALPQVMCAVTPWDIQEHVPLIWRTLMRASGDAESGLCSAAGHVRGDAGRHPGARAGAPGGGAARQEQKKKEKLEAHLYTIVKLVRDADIADQIGAHRWFDLASPEKVRRVPEPEFTSPFHQDHLSAYPHSCECGAKH